LHGFSARWTDNASAWGAVWSMVLDKRVKKGAGRQEITEGVKTEFYNTIREHSLPCVVRIRSGLKKTAKAFRSGQQTATPEEIAAAQPLTLP